MKRMKNVLIYLRKDTLVGKNLASNFTWAEAGDAVADIYSGVSFEVQRSFNWSLLTLSVVCVLVNANITWTYCLV